MANQIQEIRYQVGEAWKGTYNVATSYGNAAVVQDPTGMSVYRSLRPGNVGHPLSDTSWWMCIIDLSSMKQEIDHLQELDAELTENEAERANAEQQRVSKEQARVNAENARIQAEQTRASQESARVQAEQTRVNQEQARVSQEEARQQAEGSRLQAEEQRVSKETQRANAEQQRALAEQNRAAAEQDRIDSELERVGNEQERIDSELERVRNEQGRIQRAEQDHETAVIDHQTAVTDHQTAVTDHQTAVTDHATAESDHQRAEQDIVEITTLVERADADHMQAAEDHTRAESDHTTAASDHTQAGQDHTRAESDHQRAESDHTASETAAAAANQAATAANNAAAAAAQGTQKMEEDVQTLIENTDAVLGADEIPQFDETERYAMGDFVMKDGKLYKFLTGHAPGAWNPQEVQQTNLVKEVDDMVRSDYEEVIIDLKTETGDPLPNVEVVVTVEGEQSGRNLTTDAQGRCTTNVQKGLEYTIEASAPQGYLPSTPIIRRASLPTRYITITLIEDTQSDYEHLVVTLVYMNQNLGVADHIIVSYNGENYSIPVVDNVAEADIPIGVTYTVSFQNVDGYKTPHERSHLAQFAGRDYTMTVYYVDAIAGTRWLMNNGTERDLNDISPADKNDVFGLIVNTGDLAQANCGYIIPVDVMFNGFGGNNYLSANEEIPTLGFFGTHAAALTDLDGEQNCEKIRDYITEKATQGIARTSGIAQTVYNKCGGVGVKVFVNNTPYVTGDIVSYQNKLYEFIVDHPTGGWNANQVTEYGIGYIMPDNSIQRCFQPAYGQIYAYRLIIDSVRAITTEVFGSTVSNIASGYWWSSTQCNANNGVSLYNGAFYGNTTKSNSYTLLPVLAY